MLRHSLRGSLHQNFRRSITPTARPTSGFVCAFCDVPRRFNSTFTPSDSSPQAAHQKDDTHVSILGNFTSGKDESKYDKSTSENEPGKKAFYKGAKKNVKEGSIFKLNDSPTGDGHNSRKRNFKDKKPYKEFGGEKQGAEKSNSKRAPKKGKPSDHVARPKKSEPVDGAGTRIRRVRAKGGAETQDESGGMSISTAMNPRGTSVIEEEAGLSVSDVEVEPISIVHQKDVATLSHGLDRVLFNPGVVYLQDPRSRIFNFDPYLQKIMPVTEFDFDAVAGYITSSKDVKLEALMKEHGKKYMGSTSSMTSVLSHFHYLLSAWREINIDILSKSFSADYKSFTALSRLPTSIFLRYKGDGTYAIDSDKETDADNILSYLGRSMEKLLTLPPDEFEKYRRGNSHVLDDDTRNAQDTYHYSTFGDFLMRSQLDAHDSRLPGTGMFDLKTRAVVSIRVDVTKFHLGSGYQIKTRTGNWESFEREYFDMIRAAFLKYSLQVRMGRMDGIFVAFHNTEKIFGFQYISLDEMDAALHEGPGSGIGAQEFKMSLSLLNKLLNQATAKFPEKSLRIHFETRETSTPYMYMFAEPMEEEQIEEIQTGERGTLEEFMAKIKAQIYAHENPDSVVVEDEVDEFQVEPAEDRTEQETIEAGEIAETAEIDEAVVGTAETETSTIENVDENETADEIEASKIENADETETADEIKTSKIENADETPVAADASAEFGKAEIENDMQQDEQVDDAFLKELQDQRDKDEGKDLFGVTLTVKNIVNGSQVKRPTHLVEGDKWEVDYNIAEFSTQARAWSIYNALRMRKKKAFLARLTSTDSDQVGQYQQYIQTLAAEGRDWEKLQDERDSGREKVVFQTKST